MQKISFLLLFLLITLLYGCHAFRAIRWLEPGLNDKDKFASIPLSPGAQPYHYAYNLNFISAQRKLFFDDYLKGSNTEAFLIIKNDKIVYQYFTNNKDSANAILGFSLSKSFVGTLIGIAIDEQYIKSVHEPITNYLPELAKNDTNFKHITIQQLLDMRSGIDHNENKIGLNSPMTRLYYGKNITHKIRHLKTYSDKHRFEYRNVNTQLLSLLIERATKQKFIDYFKLKIWQPLGMEFNGKWLIDDKKHFTPKAYCGLVASVYDYAKLGSLYLHKGYFNGHQIISTNWVNQSTNADSLYLYNYRNQLWANNEFIQFDSLKSAEQYKNDYLIPKKVTKVGNQYYLEVKGNSYHMEGLYEQTIDIYPDKNLIIIRLGSEPPENAPSMENIINVFAKNF